MLNLTIKNVTSSYLALKYNVSIARCMEYMNFLTKKGDLTKREAETLLQLLAPVAPHFTEELWMNVLGNARSIHLSRMPGVDPEISLEKPIIDMPIQINGKMRGTISVERDIAEDDLLTLIKADGKYGKHLE